MSAFRAFGAALAVAVSLAAAAAAAAPPALTPQPFVSGLSVPVEIANANDGSGRLFILEMAGRVRVVRNGVLLPTPFLDITSKVRNFGEQGLLGIAFHPSYVINGRFFVYYTRPLAGEAPDGGGENVVEEYHVGPTVDVANPASGTVLVRILHPQFSNHNAGKLAFGPDGFLYIASGDGGGGGDPFRTGQNLAEARGKLLRVDVDGAGAATIPRSNPFGNGIWAYGLRNPWRFSFDRLTGDLLIADVGQGAWEEIDFEPRGSGGGRNYGWSVFEGTHCFNPSTGCSLAGHTLPVIEYGHDANGGFSVTGGYRYRGAGLPALTGYYVYGDFVSGRLWAASPDAGGHWTTTQVGSSPNNSTFGEDEAGELYIANLSAGTVQRLTPASAATVTGQQATRYRLYNPGTLEHLYTTDANEYNVLPQCCGWQQEGATYNVFTGPASIGTVNATPNYRLYNPNNFQHHWTLDANENAVLGSLGWTQEGIDGYMLPTVAPGTIPVYRLFLDTSVGLHLWTTDPNERHVLTTSAGWVDEGIAGYVLPLP